MRRRRQLWQWMVVDELAVTMIAVVVVVVVMVVVVVVVERIEEVVVAVSIIMLQCLHLLGIFTES